MLRPLIQYNTIGVHFLFEVITNIKTKDFCMNGRLDLFVINNKRM